MIFKKKKPWFEKKNSNSNFFDTGKVEVNVKRVFFSNCSKMSFQPHGLKNFLNFRPLYSSYLYVQYFEKVTFKIFALSGHLQVAYLPSVKFIFNDDDYEKYNKSK